MLNIDAPIIYIFMVNMHPWIDQAFLPMSLNLNIFSVLRKTRGDELFKLQNDHNNFVEKKSERRAGL